MASKYTGYNYLSSKGEKFIDLSNEQLIRRLTKKQQYYLREYEKMYHADLTREDIEYYLSLPDEIREEIRYKQRQILTGQSYRKGQATYLKNYATGLMNIGQMGLADLLEKAVKKSRGQLQRQAFIDLLPELDLYYGRTAEAQSKISAEMISDAVGQAANDIINYALDNNVDVVSKKFSIEQVMDLAYSGYVDDDTMRRIYDYEKSKANPDEDILQRIDDSYYFSNESK